MRGSRLQAQDSGRKRSPQDQHPLGNCTVGAVNRKDVGHAATCNFQVAFGGLSEIDTPSFGSKLAEPLPVLANNTTSHHIRVLFLV